MNLLELYAGSRSMGKEAEKAGMRVFSSDLEPFEGIDYVTDILKFDPTRVPFIPDGLWASPPCTGFSVAAIGRNWVQGEEFTPKTDTARLGILLVKKTLELYEYYKKLNPELVFWMENPRGKLRKAPFLLQSDLIRHTVTYCQYGDTRMKPTDIWTNSKTWKPRPACSNGDTCHQAAPRGSRTGTQGLNSAYERSMIPAKLCEEIINSLILL